MCCYALCHTLHNPVNHVLLFKSPLSCLNINLVVLQKSRWTKGNLNSCYFSKIPRIRMIRDHAKQPELHIPISFWLHGVHQPAAVCNETPAVSRHSPADVKKTITSTFWMGSFFHKILLFSVECWYIKSWKRHDQFQVWNWSRKLRRKTGIRNKQNRCQHNFHSTIYGEFYLLKVFICTWITVTSIIF